jgi:hypothetical protein
MDVEEKGKLSYSSWEIRRLVSMNWKTSGRRWKCSNLGYHPSTLLEELIPSMIYEPYTLQT